MWGWDRDNFSIGKNKGVFRVRDIVIGVRICYEVRFPEYFRELYSENTDINVILFYDVSDSDNIERYDMIKGHIQTRAVICTTIAVNTIASYQTAPTIIVGQSGQILQQSLRDKSGEE